MCDSFIHWIVNNNEIQSMILWTKQLPMLMKIIQLIYIILLSMQRRMTEKYNPCYLSSQIQFNVISVNKYKIIGWLMWFFQQCNWEWLWLRLLIVPNSIGLQSDKKSSKKKGWGIVWLLYQCSSCIALETNKIENLIGVIL